MDALRSNKQLIKIVSVALLVLFVIILVTSYLPTSAVPEVTSTLPAEGDTQVKPSAEIVIFFKKSLKQSQLKNIKINVSSIGEIKNWGVQSNKIIIGGRPSILQQSGIYTVTLFYKDKKIHEFSFTTEFPQDQVSLSQQALDQTIADRIFNETTAEFLARYPWYPKFPIKGDGYYVLYYFDDDLFKIVITNKDYSAFDQKAKAIQEEALKKIKETTGFEDSEIKFEIVKP